MTAPIVEPCVTPEVIPAGPPAAANAMALRGDYWEVTFDGRTAIVEDCRGLRYIALLIRDGHAGKGPVHAKELVAIATGHSSAPIELEQGEEVLDDAARTQLMRRLEEIAFARSGALDDIAAAALDEEYERISDALAGAASGRGRRRGTSFNSSSEKARKAVGKAISEAIARIESCPGLPALAEHLAIAVRKGLWLSYSGNIPWSIELPL